MENKSLGRGFREISNIFMSEDNKGKISPDKVKEDTQKSRQNNPDQPLEAFQGQFTIVDHKPGAGSQDKTDTDMPTLEAHHASTLSSILKYSGECSPLAETMCEVEEKVTVEKKIAYPNMPDAQQNVIKTLCSLLEEGFYIKTIELVKSDTKNRPGRKKSKTEKVTVFLEEPPALAKI